jgi:ABC-type polar amino acid transport system ATPase subunit
VVSIADIEGAERLLGVACIVVEHEQMVGNLEGQIASASLAGSSASTIQCQQEATTFDPRLGAFRRPCCRGREFLRKRRRDIFARRRSGCGKSSCGRSILRLVEPQSGEIWLNGREIRGLGQTDLREARRDMQMVFQDPFASLNPLRRLREQVAEPLINFGLASKPEIADRMVELFDRVDLPRSFLNQYPHELSGGQRQRVAIARAIAPHPSLVIADEAVSALDVSVHAQVLNLLASFAGRPGVVLPLHQPRYHGRRTHIALRWGHVSGTSGRGRSAASGARGRASHLHEDVDGRGPGRRS